MEAIRPTSLIVAKKDFDQLMHYLRTNEPELQYDRLKARQLIEELNKAKVVNSSEVPGDVIRLYSKVVVRNTIARQNYHYMLVLPNETDLKQEKISILSPIGGALLGAVKGDTISLPSPRGQRFFTVLEVTNPVD